MGPDGAPFASLHRFGVPCWRHCYPVLLMLLLPLLVPQPANGLPITSKPLDNNPDHLTWEAAWLSEDNSRGALPMIGGKTKKITPKSIFITPFLNSYNTSACPPDFKVDYNGKCIQVVSINTADILVTKLQSLFAQHGQDTGGPGGAGGEDDYDYDYDATGPYQVNLPLSIDLSPELPVVPAVSQGPKLTYQDNLGPSFYDSAMVDIATVEQDKAKITTVSVDGASNKPFLATTAATNAGPAGTTFSSSSSSSTGSSTGSDQTGAESDISFLAFESLPNGTLAGQIELDGHNRTVVQSIFVSSTTPDTPATGDGGGSSSTTQSATTTELDTEPGTPTDRVGDTVATDATMATGTTLGSTVPVRGDTMTTTTAFDQEETYTIDREEASSTTQNVASSTPTEAGTAAALLQFDADPEETLKLELAEESLLLENNHSSTVSVDLSTTDVSDMIDLDTVPTSETESSDEPTIVTGQEASTTKSSDNGGLPPSASTKPSVQIITPIRGNWDLGFMGGSPVPAQLVAASHVQQDRTTRATPETTTVAIERWTEQPPKARNSSETDRSKAAAANEHPIVAEGTTRFRYQLPTSTQLSPAAIPVSSTSFALEIKPIPTTPPNNDRYMEQLRKINEIVAEKRRLQQQQEQQLASSSSTRIRFPSRDDEPLRGAESVSHYQQAAGAVRFPGTATNRLTPSGNRLPDIFPKKSADSTTQRPAFWWLPSGWEVDQTGNKPMLLRFWSRMPLVRDSSAPPASGTESQTEHLSNNNRLRSSSSFQQPQHYQQQQQQQQFSNHLPAATGASHPVASARGNSKSPSENFYKEVSAQEVYKVMNARQLNHRKR
ncbi:mucin-2-like [Anopheles bellator]|uniref:mucin-2-like n=1 Tax=Anopheles bellator TaxID=139047 RepID=UPI00264A36DF|nr:mucin-2-like [Anopheles bellator]